MAKAAKKKNRRMRKMLRKTLGTLFLISAIVVAAIPVEGLEASSGNTTLATSADRDPSAVKVTIEKADSKIPYIDSDEPIYTTADGTYQFAYVSTSGSNQKFAVILGYNKLNVLDGNKLTIPDVVDAYVQYTYSMGTTKGYVAVGKANNPLFYEYSWTEYEDVEKVDEETGETITETVEVIKKELRPCYVEDIANWEDTKQEDFYYEKPGDTSTVYPGYAKTSTEDYQRIQGAEVRYIGNQYLTENDGTWKVEANNDITADNASKGIFADCGNIVDLEVGEKLLGIGNYAFWHCTGLKSITLGNGLNTIGNGAFSDCANMQYIDMPVNSNISVIGSEAFYNCRALQNFIMPASVSKIGDSAFEGCTAISYVDLCSGGQNNVLTELGYDVFKDCESLKYITFPATYAETVDISMFEGCKNLQYITARNKNLTFSQADGVYTFDEFKLMLGLIDEEGNAGDGTFYFEGFARSALHDFTKEYCFAFSHIDSDEGEFYKLDKYELTQLDTTTGGKTTYVVNSQNQLIAASFEGTVETLDIPRRIGPYGISDIGSGVFQNKCNLKLVKVPDTVVTIADNAFKGCHNLANVIFESGNVEIGANAFRTQDNTGHSANNCEVKTNASDNSPVVKLHFTGPISSTSGPFNYAMSVSGRYNNGEQTESFITYYSGWPQNLEINFNYDPTTGIGKSELVDFPAYTELKGKYTTSNYAYITTAHEKAANEALTQYKSNPLLMTEDQRAIINAALSLEIPEGVDAIKDGLFKAKEKADGTDLKKSVTAYGLESIQFSGVDSDDDGKIDSDIKSDFSDCDSLSEITLLGNTTTIDQQAFEGCDNLEIVNVSSNTEKIGDYAFKDCANLTDVSISDTVSLLGIRPFAGCAKLSAINFQNSPYYSCENSIIFGLASGAKNSIVQCLEGRESKYVRSSDVSGITKLEEEAFMNTSVREIDLTDTTVSVIPTRAFAETPELRTVKLPYTCQMLSDCVFENSTVDYIEAPVALTLLDQKAFDGMLATNGGTSNEDVTFCCETDSYIYNYAKLNGYSTTDLPIERYYTVLFRDWEESVGGYVLVDEQDVLSGQDAVPPTPKGREGYVFTKWDPDYREITADVTCMAVYETAPEDYNKFKVVFQDYDGTELDVVYVVPGGTAESPKDPTREGYVFKGWDRPLTNVQESFTTIALYDEIPEGQYVVRYHDKDENVIYTTTVVSGGDAPAIQAPAVDGYSFVKWQPGLTGITKDTDTYAIYERNADGSGSGSGSGSGDGSGSGNGTGSSNGSSAQTYVLTVKGGSGSGSYVAGTKPIIIANDAPKGQKFSSWTVDPADVEIDNKENSVTYIKMPERNVTVTVNYKADGSSTTTGSGNSSNSNSNRPGSNAGTITNSGTTVVIDKNGLSNTGVVSATVNGSSDNFTIKITESSAAAEAAVKALLAEYGDLNDIKYFPMDISLYDSTGKNKITDTRGLSISITLPLPDSLITYAGNNKVAGIVNERLDKLSPKFTTINGVSCVTFTAEHFSPYVIYVDTDNLTAGTITDSTPKTGDGIHPKWFLSIGLACIAVVLFMKQDKRNVRKATA